MDLDVKDAPQETGEGNGHAPLVEKAKQQAQQVFEKTQQKAGEVMEQAGTQIQTRLDERKEAAAGSLSEIAQVVRSTSDHLHHQQQPVAATVADYVTQAADAVEHVATYIRDKSTEQIVQETENFARRQPVVFLGSAFALGFLAARFLKSSNPNPQPAWQSGGYQEGAGRSGQRVQQTREVRPGNVPAPTAS